MLRMLLALAAAVFLAGVGLAALYLLGEGLTFLGLFLRGTAGVLSKLLVYLLLACLSGGLAYFLASVYRRP